MKTIERVDIPNVEYWDGKTDMDSPLLVVYEQGLGDNILYYRFMIELSELYPNMNIHYFCKDTISHIFKEFPNIKIIDNVIPFEEVFIGSNIKSYKHKYYLAILVGNTIPLNPIQYSEISKIDWLSYEECLENIREYSIEKKNILSNVNNLFCNYKIFF